MSEPIFSERRVQRDSYQRGSGGPVSRAAPLAAQSQPAQNPGSRIRVAVCIATFRRPTGLRRLLESIAALDTVPGGEIFVVVVDNDAEAPCRLLVSAVRDAGFPFPLVYDVEPERNIARARNLSVSHALDRGAGWLAFVDDDEEVSPRWLAALCEIAERHGAEVVSGAKRPRCPDDTPEWLLCGTFFGQNEQRTGVSLPVAHTGNALVSAHTLSAFPQPFDPSFGLSGGSDSHLFMRLRRRGARIVSAGEALTFENIPPSRGRAGWVLRRAFRVGNTAILCERRMDRGLAHPWQRFAKALARLGLGVAMLPTVLLGGRRRAMEAGWNIMYGLGAGAAMLGYRYLEYARVHGE
jgi:succinoglycan biosynthesis protein ExoM